MKKLMVGMLVAGMALLGASGAAHAISISGGALLADGYTYYDTGAEQVVLVDTDAVLDDSTVFLFLEFGDYAPNNVLGIYDADASLQVFAGSAAPLTSVTLEFNLAAGTVKNKSTGAIANIGSVFGFYLIDPYGNKFYSQTALNADGFDHFKIYDTTDNVAGSLMGSNVVLGIEDLYGGGDKDFDDMVVGASDVKPVPEPGTMLLLGSGLLGLGLLRRRRRQ